MLVTVYPPLDVIGRDPFLAGGLSLGRNLPVPGNTAEPLRTRLFDLSWLLLELSPEESTTSQV
jgi:hypothetical protein